MKNILIATIVLAANSTAFAGEFYGDDTLGWISDYQGHQSGCSTIRSIPADSAYMGEFYGDDTLTSIVAPVEEHDFSKSGNSDHNR